MAWPACGRSASRRGCPSRRGVNALGRLLIGVSPACLCCPVRTDQRLSMDVFEAGRSTSGAAGRRARAPSSAGRPSRRRSRRRVPMRVSDTFHPLANVCSRARSRAARTAATRPISQRQHRRQAQEPRHPRPPPAPILSEYEVRSVAIVHRETVGRPEHR
jgi:hypothetical protein